LTTQTKPSAYYPIYPIAKSRAVQAMACKSWLRTYSRNNRPRTKHKPGKG